MSGIMNGACLSLMVLLSAGCTMRHTDFGEPMTLGATDEVRVSEVLGAAERYDGKFVRVKGTVEDVCKGKGCWLTMTDAETDECLRVKFICELIEDRLIPMDAVGQKVMVEGTLKLQEISEEMRKHYAEEAGKSSEEVAKIVGPKTELRFESPSARIFGTFKQAAYEEKPDKKDASKSED